ncbi:hypothetical protein [Propionicicella superfundia]|uniref:hypothetical protein n=1 Tax=Propionicicella superfundia TaxID=348582 RepID=UPI0004288B26|nr:hypothetical protein [Propionicicella superfundia]
MYYWAFLAGPSLVSLLLIAVAVIGTVLAKRARGLLWAGTLVIVASQLVPAVIGMALFSTGAIPETAVIRALLGYGGLVLGVALLITAVAVAGSPRTPAQPPSVPQPPYPPQSFTGQQPYAQQPSSARQQPGRGF